MMEPMDMVTNRDERIVLEQKAAAADEQALAELELVAGWHVLCRQLDQRIASVRRELEGGKLSYDDYHLYAGELRGLLTARNATSDKPKEGPDAT
jgi:hypothetical protein